MPFLSLPCPWLATVGLCLALLTAHQAANAADLSRIETIVVLFPENRSFDHLYGLFPGANGIGNAAITMVSVLPYLRVWGQP